MTGIAPILIVGAARSGTKHLRAVLGAGLQAAIVPYDVNFIWRHGIPSTDDDELTIEQIEPNVEYIQQYLERTVKKARSRDRSLHRSWVVEKTVANTLRVPAIRAALPDVRFVHLERSGHDVVESAFRSWHEPLSIRYLAAKLPSLRMRDWRYAGWSALNQMSASRDGPPIWGPRYAGLEQDLLRHGLPITCALQWKRCVEASRAAIDVDTFCIDYHSVAERGLELRALFAWLGADPDAALDRLKGVALAESSGRWPGAIPVADREACESIVASIPPRRDN